MMKINFYTTVDEVVPFPEKEAFYLITEDIEFRSLPSSKNERVGAVVPHVIANNTLYETGVLQVLFDEEKKVKFHFLNMKDEIACSFQDNSSLILLLDALTPTFEPFIEKLGMAIDANNSVFGSGVGSRSFTPEKVIFYKDDIFAEHALIVEVLEKMSIGVQHGWNPLFGPIVVTKANGTCIQEINHEKAFEFYAKMLKDLANKEIREDNFFEVAKAFPLGILSYADSEFTVRDPLGISEDGGLNLVNSIAENETVYIMQGEAQSLIDSARENASMTMRNKNSATNLLFDCISRVLYMEDDFQKELQAISEASAHAEFYGITSIGEITNKGANKLNIYNKTNLIGVVNHESI